jgi:hypothetical protein
MLELIVYKKMVSKSEAQALWEVFWLTLVLLPFALYFKAVWAFFTTPRFQRKIEKRNILYVIAHPDDEAMFFVPSIVQLRKTNELYLLCLSNGNFDGLGKIREKELYASAKYLGFKEAKVVDHPELADGMKSYWNPDVIGEEIKKYMTSL